MEIEGKSFRKLPQLTYSDVISMYERGALSVSVMYRRDTLLALAELAARSWPVNPSSRGWTFAVRPV